MRVDPSLDPESVQQKWQKTNKIKYLKIYKLDFYVEIGF